MACITSSHTYCVCLQVSFIIDGLDPYTNYSVIVRAVGTVVGGAGLLTADSVRVARTYTATDTPPTIITPTPDSGRNTFVIQLPDPDLVDTGPVMYDTHTLTHHSELFLNDFPLSL